ncbi:MAG TPA: diguanylate cyclase [Dongiaceae bacterium]|nr:diguanylate cyclase [Dongiaceae bacterium]
MLRIMLLICLLWAGLGVARADAPIPSLALSGEGKVMLDNAVRYLQDAGGALTVDQVRQPGTVWQQNGEHAFKQGYNASAWWLHLRLSNPDSLAQQRMLELSYAVLDYVDAYVYSGDTQLQHYQMGDRYPYSQRPVESRLFVIPLQWEPGQTLDLYYRIQSSSSVQAPLVLWQDHAFSTFENNSTILQGFYYGAMVVIVIYNLLIFFMLWERSYFYYVGFVLSMPLFMAAFSGDGFRYLWPNNVAMNDHAIPVFLAASLMFGALFTRSFLRLNRLSNRLDKLVLTFAILGGSMMVVSPFLPYHITIKLLVPLGLFACMGDMLAGVVAWRRGVATARYYCIAWASFLTASMVLALNKLNFLPTNWFTEYSIQFGAVLEAVLLSFALAERINVERRLRYEAQTDALQVTRRLNEDLELRVHERTEELEKANRKLEELSQTDQLTGLKNRRFLDGALREEWNRCQRYQHSLSLLLLDIDFFKKVNDEHGHQTGDFCLQQVAKRIAISSRWPSDKVARYGGEEFCLLLPETDAAGAMIVAERIRAAIASEPIETDAGSLSVTVSLGVFTLIPDDNSSLEQLVHNADMALYTSKEHGRNRITQFSQLDVCNVAQLPMRKRH